MHSKPTADRSRLGQLILILVLDPLLHDLPTALAPIRQRCVKLLINLLGGLTVTVPPVLLAGPTTRPTRTPRRLPARERRRLTLGRTPRLLQLALELRNPRPQVPVLTHKPRCLTPQQLVLSRQLRAARRQTRKLIHRLGRKHLHL
jgi:hypothetical protein